MKILRNKYESSKGSLIISYVVPVAVDNLGSRSSAEKTEGDGQTNSCDRVAGNSKKNIRNEYARHGGAVVRESSFSDVVVYETSERDVIMYVIVDTTVKRIARRNLPLHLFPRR